MKSVEQYNLGGFSVGIIDGKWFMKCVVEMDSDCMIYMPTSMKIGYYLEDLKSYTVGITNAKGL
jgi:hypothetical protein